ncbi:MAG: M23 family metallopeptidase [Bacteroidales bacterium]|nr:M23 family metallopeptidase [Bacteroidales bacterium]
MAKSKFRFNPETLQYEKIETTFKRAIGVLVSYIVMIVMVGFAFMFTWLHFFPSTREKQLIDENKMLRSQYKTLNGRLSNMEKVMNDLADKDNNIYRMVFESEPIPDAIRNGGFGGVNRYVEIEAIPNMEIVVKTNQRMDILMKKIYIQSLSFDTIVDLAKNKQEMLQHIPGIQPLKTYKYVSGYGTRMHPIYKTLRTHSGIDLVAPSGTKIYATGDGVVKTADFERGYGKTVVIDHGYKYQSMYAHCSELLVHKGQKVKRGEVIALVGNTGVSTGSHLHYEIIKNGQKVNPINYFLNDLSANEFEEIRQISIQPNQSFD